MSRPKKKVAGVVTVYYRGTHADVLIGKILDGYLHDGGAGPNLQLVSLYIDQDPKGDLSPALAKKHGFKLCGTIEQALTLGGKELAVDGVICVGEHGDYPSNAREQILYPRRRFLRQLQYRLPLCLPYGKQQLPQPLHDRVPGCPVGWRRRNQAHGS